MVWSIWTEVTGWGLWRVEKQELSQWSLTDVMSFPRTGQTNDKTKEIDLLFFVFFFIYEQFSFLYSENITPAVRNVLNYSWRSVNFGQGLLMCGKNSLRSVLRLAGWQRCSLRLIEKRTTDLSRFNDFISLLFMRIKLHGADHQRRMTSGVVRHSQTRLHSDIFQLWSTKRRNKGKNISKKANVRIRVPFMPCILKSSRSWTHLSLFTSEASDSLTWKITTRNDGNNPSAASI